MRNRSCGVLLCSVILAASACEDENGGGGCEPYPGTEYPIHRVTLFGESAVNGTDPTNRVDFVIGGNHTFALGTRRLQPPSNDGLGVTHRIEWDPSFPSQEIIAFDTDYAEGLEGGAACPLCFVPYRWRFVSVGGTWGQVGTEKTYNFVEDDWIGGSTQHLVRYWHGDCALIQPWQVIFDQVSAGLRQGAACVAEDIGASGTAEFDVFQPHFTSDLENIRMGFLFESILTFSIAGVFGTNVYMNPSYEMGVNPSNGLLRVVSTQQKVVVTNNPFSSIKPQIQNALANTLPRQLEQSVAALVTSPLTGGGFPGIPCDPSASEATQQAACFAAVTNGGAMAPAFLFFRAAHAAAGINEPQATNIANRSVSALESRNFACDSAGICAFHPVFERLNVLPDNLEVVLSDEFNDPRTDLYNVTIPAVLALVGAPPINTCTSEYDRPDDFVAFVEHGSEDLVVTGDCPELP